MWMDKMVVTMPDTSFNNAFVAPGVLGYEPVSVIPTVTTLDFTTEFGLLPDPGIIACHELTHYVHFSQVAGFWSGLDLVFGPLYTPHAFVDPWFSEGWATHHEAKLSPGTGRPMWPIFTGIFAAGYAGQHIHGGDLSEHGRLAPVDIGHHYLVGTLFLRYLTERYGEKAVWTAIASQARQITGLFFAGTFKDGFGKSLGDLIDEFDRWHAQTFPVRVRPAAQRTIATLGSNARYARGRDGTEAWVSEDVDQPPRLVVRDPGGATLAEIALNEILPPRPLVDAAVFLVSGLSVTADGREVWLTVSDRDTTENVPRLLRWRRGDGGLTELTHALGPGATIDPTGATYYYCATDGDRWSLAAWDVRTGARRVLFEAPPGTYVLGAQVSADGARLVASAWDGSAFVAWVLDAATGARLAEIRGDGTPIWDASFTEDGRVVYLGVVDGRFQLFVDGQPVTDAPYAVLAARGARGTIRFLNRDGWRWTLDEIAAPAAGMPAAATAAPPAPASAVPASAAPASAAPPSAAPVVSSDEPYSVWDHFLFPQVRLPSIIGESGQTVRYGASIGGGDRLGLQRWSLEGHVQPATRPGGPLHGGGEVDYLNTMAAPWTIVANVGIDDWADPVEQDGTSVTRDEERRTRDVALTVARTWRDTLTTALGGVYTEDFDQPPDQPRLDRKLGGPALSLAWQSVEATPYVLRRALAADASAAYYPHALSSFAGDIYDVGGGVVGVVPLPWTARHTLTLQLRGRALVAAEDTHLLQLGGLASGNELASASSVATAPTFDDTRFPPNLRFIEYLRGYEDYAITTDRAAVASLAWRYPLIIDRGVASTLWLFPASFVSQLDLELFASGAIDRCHDLHAAAGGELRLQMTLLRAPLVLGYQVARRVRDDNAVTQLLELEMPL
ncbi:MAG TPA: hypothetical protein VHW23_15695 [Kofleriaceae bacterium]|jgi:hypothetical protein|nr:hypothetical protein [Kofleriaceae bacterium]